MYLKEFEIRWNDLDANGHLANSAYTNFMSHSRLSFFAEYGLQLTNRKKHHIGAVAFYEHIYYFKESFEGKIRVATALSGLSEDGMFFKMDHNFYDEKGQHLAFCEMQGGWIDLGSRRLTSLPNLFREALEKAPKSSNFHVLSKKDTRKHNIYPKNL